MSENISLITKIKYGAHLYGTDTPESDLDIKGVFLPTAEQILLGEYPDTIRYGRKKKEGERNNKDDVDFEYVSLRRFLKLLMEGQTMALDMFFSLPENQVDEKAVPQAFRPGEERGYWSLVWSDIQAEGHVLFSKNIKAFVGYARQQASKYGIKGSRLDAVRSTMLTLQPLPSADRLSDHLSVLGGLLERSKGLLSMEEEPLVQIVSVDGVNDEKILHLMVCGKKFPLHSRVKLVLDSITKTHDEYGARSQKASVEGGIDWKALSHAVRVNSQAVEFLTTGKMTFPRPDADLLLKIKLGQMPYPEVAETIEKGVEAVYRASLVSPLPEEPDKTWADKFVKQVHLEVVQVECGLKRV